MLECVVLVSPFYAAAHVFREHYTRRSGQIAQRQLAPFFPFLYRDGFFPALYRNGLRNKNDV